MIDNIVITPGLIIVILCLMCGTIHSLISKTKWALENAFFIVIFYGIFKFLTGN